jgi:hypothetical protein
MWTQSREAGNRGVMLRVEKSLVLLGVVACLTIAAAGCGSSSDSTSSTAADGAGGTGSTAAAGVGSTAGGEGGSASDRGKSAGEGGSASDGGKSTGGDSSTAGGNGSNGSGSNSGSSVSGNGGSGKTNAGSGGPPTNDNGARLGADTTKNGDNSIESYGTDAEGPEKAAVIGAMRSFVLAVATRDYDGVCAGLAEKIREGLAESNKRCPELLETLMTIPPAEAQRSANGTVTDVRVGGGNAFVLFRPAGGGEADYFVMTLEDGGWKSLGLTVGTPLNPSAPTE